MSKIETTFYVIHIAAGMSGSRAFKEAERDTGQEEEIQ